jgi:hypothetical protein
MHTPITSRFFISQKKITHRNSSFFLSKGGVVWQHQITNLLLFALLRIHIWTRHPELFHTPVLYLRIDVVPELAHGDDMSMASSLVCLLLDIQHRYSPHSWKKSYLFRQMVGVLMVNAFFFPGLSRNWGGLKLGSLRFPEKTIHTQPST